MKNIMDVLGEQDPNTMIMSKSTLRGKTGLTDGEFEKQIRDLIRRGLVQKFTTQNKNIYVDYYALTHYGHDTYIESRKG